MAEERNKVADMQGEGFTAFVLYPSLFVLHSTSRCGMQWWCCNCTNAERHRGRVLRLWRLQLVYEAESYYCKLKGVIYA